MKLKKTDANKFMEVVESCRGPVYLTDWGVNNDGEPNLKLNLKSTISLHLGIVNLLTEHGDWFEIHAVNKEDEAKIMEFIIEENQ